MLRGKTENKKWARVGIRYWPNGYGYSFSCLEELEVGYLGQDIADSSRRIKEKIKRYNIQRLSICAEPVSTGNLLKNSKRIPKVNEAELEELRKAVRGKLPDVEVI